MSKSVSEALDYMRCVHLGLRFLPGMTSSIFRGARLNGSLGSLRRWERMVDLSIDVFEVGRMTGSSISVYISGSNDESANSRYVVNHLGA